jgi:hypothetical protein
MRGLQTIPTPGRRPSNNHCRLSSIAKKTLIPKSNQSSLLYLSKVVYKKARPAANIKI